MSKLNKIITNQPIVLTEEEVNNLSETLSAVRTAGGGEGGHLYTGDNKYIGVDNGNYKIKFLDNAAAKLESISSKLDKTEAATTYQTKTDMSAYLTTAIANSDYAKKTEIPDSISAFDDTDEIIYSYLYPLTADIQSQINAKQNKLQFDLNAKGEISAIGLLNNTTTAIAGAGGVTGDYYSASNPSGFINSAQAETQILAKNYITSGVSELDNFYSKTDTSSRTEIANAIKDFITEDDVLEKHYLTKASGDLYYLPKPTELVEGTQYAYTTQGWSPIQGGGGASGISFVNHDETLTGDGNTVKLGVNTTKIQTKLTDAEIQNIADVTTLKTASSTWDNVSAKLNTTDFNTYTATTAPATYQPIGNYLSSNALEGYATTALLDTISSKIESDIPTTVAQLTDSGNYYLKTDTSSKSELSNEFAKYVTSSDVTIQDTDYVMTTTGWKVLTLPGGGMTQVIHDETLTGQGNANDNKLGVVWSALSGNTIDSAKSAYWAVKAKTNDGQHEYTIGSELLHLNTITQYLDGWAETIIGDKGIEIIDTNDDTYPDTFQLTQTAYNAVTSVSSKLDTTAFSTVSGTFLTKSSADNDYAPISITSTVNTLTAASAGWNNKVDKPTSLVNKYLVLRTDSNGAVSGWEDLKKECYSKTEATGTFVATANIDTTTLSGDGKTVSTKLGVKTDVIATIDYVSGNYLPTSGGTVSGQLVVSGGSNFDQQFLKITRENVNGHARLGLGQYGALALKADDSNSHTTQINVSPNTTNDQLVQVQHNGGTVGYLIPAVTATSTDGLTNDGILHIILES